MARLSVSEVIAGDGDCSDVGRRHESGRIRVHVLADHRDAAAVQRVLRQRWMCPPATRITVLPGSSTRASASVIIWNRFTTRYVTLAPDDRSRRAHLHFRSMTHARVEALGRQIRGDHPDGVHLVGVLKGAFMFMSDLARAIDGNTTLDFIAVSSYGSSTKSSGRCSS